MTKYAVSYAAVLLTMLVVDGLWLGVVAKNFYQTNLAGLMAERINFVAAAAFYLIYPIGVVYFAASAGIETGSWRDAAVRGLLFGFFAYAVYDLTNWATLRGFPFQVALVDMAWGSTLTGLAATLGMLAARYIAPNT